MSQVGEAHQILMRYLEWTAKELEALRQIVELFPETDAGFILGAAKHHLENARRLADQIDSGVVYSNEEKETRA